MGGGAAFDLPLVLEPNGNTTQAPDTDVSWGHIIVKLASKPTGHACWRGLPCALAMGGSGRGKVPPGQQPARG
jgi:hypothetical protein